MARFDEAFLAQVREATDLAALIGEHVRLEKRGGRYWGLCPFHGEKTPSFTIVPERQIYHCFGCKASGDGFRFLMDKDHFTFGEAVEMLAKRAGIALPEPELSPEEVEARSDRRQVLGALEIAARYFEHQLHHTAAGQKALAYLTARGISLETAQRFRLGYAPDAWESLQRALRARIEPEWLLKAGLISSRDGGGYYDRFRHRLMFPITDLRGRILAFGGRALAADQTPKYYNSPEGLVYNKRQHLYGLAMAKEAMRSADRAILVEGYMDAIALHQAGFTAAVASLGTALTPDQVSLLRRQASQVLIAYDADTAGQHATLRGLELLSRAGAHVLVVQIPAGKDPDDLVRTQGAAGFQAAISGAKPLIEFKLMAALAQQAQHSIGTEAEGKAAAVEAVLPVLAEIPSEVRRAEYLKHIAETLQISHEALLIEFRRFARRQQQKQPEGHNQSRNWNNVKVLDTGAGVPVPVQRAERLLLQHVCTQPEWAGQITGQLGAQPFLVPAHIAIWNTISDINSSATLQGTGATIAKVLSVLEDETARTLLTELEVQPLPTRDPQQEVHDCIRSIQRHRLQQQLDSMNQRLSAARDLGQEPDPALVMELSAALSKLRELMDRSRQ